MPRSGMARFAILLVAACGATPSTSPPAAHGLAAEVDAYLAPLAAIDVFQGAVLIARADSILLAKGYGLANVELGIANTPARVFRIASLSKAFTQVALGKLVEDGKLALADPLSRYLPGHPQGDRITLDMLRTHRAGIPNENSIPYDEEASAPNTLARMVDKLMGLPLRFEPGARTGYSNGGYALLAAVIEKVTGLSYADYLERSVLRPLGLTHTRHEADGTVIANRAFGYVPGPVRRHEMMVAPFQEMATKTGGGSLVSTVEDLHRFLRAFYRDNAIRADTWKQLFPVEEGTLAFQGRCPGYNVFMIRDVAHDVDAVVLANNYAAGMVATVGRDLVALARGLPVERPRWRADLALDASEARAYAGSYRAPPGELPYDRGPFAIAWRGDELVLMHEGTPLDVLLPQGDNAFLARVYWSEFRFVPGDGQLRATVRPLWLERAPIALERLP
jgi:CubicO group peptidase (beta-lactamase class C family)